MIRSRYCTAPPASLRVVSIRFRMYVLGPDERAIEWNVYRRVPSIRCRTVSKCATNAKRNVAHRTVVRPNYLRKPYSSSLVDRSIGRSENDSNTTVLHRDRPALSCRTIGIRLIFTRKVSTAKKAKTDHHREQRRRETTTTTKARRSKATKMLLYRIG